MSEFWRGALLGFILGVLGNIIVTHYAEFVAQYRAYAAAKKLAGKWEAYNIRGRVIDATPIPGAGVTSISTKPHWWSADSHVLQVTSVDVSSGRRHTGTLVIDRVCPRIATRILIYDPGDEVVEQRIVISEDLKRYMLFYVTASLGLTAYNPVHVLRKIEAAA
jgi:hypothetical protein